MVQDASRMTPEEAGFLEALYGQDLINLEKGRDEGEREGEISTLLGDIYTPDCALSLKIFVKDVGRHSCESINTLIDQSDPLFQMSCSTWAQQLETR